MARHPNNNEGGSVSRQVVPHYEVQKVPLAFEGVDERNGWHDRGNPQNAFDDDERISLCAEEMGKLLQWLLLGGSVRNQDRSAPVNAMFKERYRGRQLKKSVQRPSIIGYRVIAMLLRMRPDLLEGRSAAQLARSMRLHPRMLAHYTISFGENFPGASKSIRRRSRLVNDEVVRSRHQQKHV